MKNITFTEFIQDACGGKYPLSDIFNNLLTEEIVEVIGDYKAQFPSFNFTEEENIEINKLLDNLKNEE